MIYNTGDMVSIILYSLDFIAREIANKQCLPQSSNSSSVE